MSKHKGVGLTAEEKAAVALARLVSRRTTRAALLESGFSMRTRVVPDAKREASRLACRKKVGRDE